MTNLETTIRVSVPTTTTDVYGRIRDRKITYGLNMVQTEFDEKAFLKLEECVRKCVQETESTYRKLYGSSP